MTKSLVEGIAKQNCKDALPLPYLGKLQLELTALHEKKKKRNLCMIDINDMKHSSIKIKQHALVLL